MHLTVAHDFLPKTNSTRASIVMDHFGIDFETGRHVIAEDLTLPIQPGDVVLFTGASGSGKSSLLREASRMLEQDIVETRFPKETGFPDVAENRVSEGNPVLMINIAELDLGEGLLIDALPLPIAESMQLLSACGLGEAHLMLRTPAELSDGQCWRFRLALGLARRPQWLLADEFTATLDRTLARVIALNVRRLAESTGTGFLLATTHEDITADLAPDVHVQCRLDGEIRIVVGDGGAPQEAPVRGASASQCAPPLGAISLKKKPSASQASSNSPQRPKPTERPEQATALPFVVPESEFPAPFRRRGKVLSVVANGPLTMRKLRMETGISPGVLKSVVSDLIAEGAIAECSAVDGLGRRHDGYRLAATSVAG